MPPQVAAPTTEEPSLGELVSAATRDLSTLIRSEIELAKMEIGAEVGKAAIGAGAFGGAAFLAVFAFLLLSFAAAYGLAEAVDLWLSFLIVGGAYLLIAAVIGLVGARSLKTMGKPERTMRTAAETVAALKNRKRG